MNIDNYKVKGLVDEKGIDALIKQSAQYAATSGAIMGALGPIALLGLPVDIINNITQQFRVTLGVIYDKTGKFKPDFNSFMRIVAISLGIEAGATITKMVLIQTDSATDRHWRGRTTHSYFWSSERRRSELWLHHLYWKGLEIHGYKVVR